jgi:hypothetical protein
MRKVIFVGGTAYSGSTLFHLMLANDPKGFALGEIRWLFDPLRADHLNRICGCGDPNCPVWPQIRRNGRERIYETVFDLFPEVEFIVDSSKQPFWMRTQADHLARRGIATEQVLIWKTPLEFAASTKKRNRMAKWDSKWINYHRLYFSLIPCWRAVAYRPLTKDPQVLQAACEHVGIPWFAGKEEYWQRSYHAFGGNRSATFHLYKEEEARVQLIDYPDENMMRYYRRIYENKQTDHDLEQIVATRMRQRPLFAPILQVLEQNSVLQKTSDLAPTMDLRFPSWLVALRRLKSRARTQIAKVRLRR